MEGNQTDHKSNDHVDKSNIKSVAGNSLSIEMAGQISDNLLFIINKAAKEHQQWMQQWYQWANSMMMQMQPIPPQAQMDLDGRQQALTEFVLRFKPTAEALAQVGLKELSALLDSVETGARENARIQQQANAKMQSDNIKTQQEILNIQRSTNAYVSNLHSSAATEASKAQDRSHENFMRTLRS